MDVRDPTPIVYLVDDDASVRSALARALSSFRYAVRACGSVDEFLDQHDPDAHGCVVADVSMPGRTGLELQELLAAQGCARPIVFITAWGTVPMSVQAMRAGAVTFLPKPVHLSDLVGGVREALERDRVRRADLARRDSFNARLDSLTRREREVLNLVVTGRLNKQIAAELGTALKTVKIHRGRVMAKMKVRTVAELVALTAAHHLDTESSQAQTRS